MKQKMKTAVISQPTYLPWPGYFRLMKEADVYVFLDNVQFEPRSWQCRNRIKSASGCVWLTVPTHHGCQCKISEVEIDNSKPWQRQHWNAFKTSYGKAQYFTEYSRFFQSVYEAEWTKLAPLNVHIIKYLAAQLGISPLFVQASTLGVEGRRTHLLLELCKSLGIGRYLSSIGAREYMEKDGAKQLFEREGMTVEFMQFDMPSHPQLFGDFVPGLSVVDCLFNCGPSSSQLIFNEKSATFTSL